MMSCHVLIATADIGLVDAFLEGSRLHVWLSPQDKPTQRQMFALDIRPRIDVG